MFAFREVFSNLCFNSCIEARFVALVQLSLARLSETFTKITAFLTAVWLSPGSLFEPILSLAVIAVAVPVCSQQPKRLGRDLNSHSQPCISFHFRIF